MTRLDSSGAAPAAGGAPRRCVLVVDDDERIRRVLERILGAHGIEANTAASGKEAVRMTASGAYDLVILDLLMPGEDGFSVLKDLARRDPDQAILVLSCLSDPESKVTSLGLGADDYVPKPFHVEELVARVQARLHAVRGRVDRSWAAGASDSTCCTDKPTRVRAPLRSRAGSSSCYGSSSAIPERCSPKRSCSHTSGGPRHSSLPTWSTSTSVGCEAGSALT